MPLNDASARAREQALSGALDLHRAIHGDLQLQLGVDAAHTIDLAETEILTTAETFAAWLQGTTTIHLTRGPITHQTTGHPGQIPEGDTVQIHDDEKFTLTVHTADAKGFETADVIEWSVDNPAVASLEVSDDARTVTVVAGIPGSAVITVTDTSTSPQLAATEAVDVVPGGTATITLAEGPVEKQ